MKDVSIVILGDICPSWGNRKEFDTLEPWRVFHDILPVLKNADFVVGNLEAPVTEKEKKLEKNSINLKAIPRDFRVLKKAGIKGVSLANNHILDYGSEGLNDTILYAEKNEIITYGVCKKGKTADCAMVKIRDIRVGFLAFAEHEFNCAEDYMCGANMWDDITSLLSIKEAKKQVDYLIIQYHGGIENYRYPSPNLQRKCRAMADAGADFITCQHSHCVGTREYWKEAEILYGQGNSVFGYEKNNSEWNTGLLVRLSLGKVRKTEYIPIEAKQDGIYLMGQEKTKKYLEEFENESKKIENSSFIKENWVKFCLNQRDAYLPMLFAWGRIRNKMNRILKGRLIRDMTTRNARRNTMNLIRCDAHREVVITLLEKDFYK